jgi:hypothetical protein
MRLRIGQHARLAAGVLVAACSTFTGHRRLGERLETVLGSGDGYVFVFSPFNCSLQGDQVDEMNTLAARTRRSAIVLATGPANLSDSAAASAVARLGIRLKARSLAGTDLEDLAEDTSLGMPLVLAIRHGEVIGILSGATAERLDTWIPWLENRRVGHSHSNGIEE